MKKLPKEKELPKEMLQAFRRIEQRVANQSAQSNRSEEQELREREFHRKKVLERVTLGITLLFSIFVGLAASMARDGNDPSQSGAMASGESSGGAGGDSKVDCNDSRLKFTRSCMEKASENAEVSWTRLSRGDSRPFSVHDKEGKEGIQGKQ